MIAVILALSDANVGLLGAAALAALGGVLIAVVNAVASNRNAKAALSATKAIDKALGTPNGHGNVVEMQERLLINFAEHATQNAREHAEGRKYAEETRSDVVDVRTHVQDLAAKLEKHLSSRPT